MMTHPGPELGMIVDIPSEYRWGPLGNEPLTHATISHDCRTMRWRSQCDSHAMDSVLPWLAADAFATISQALTPPGFGAASTCLSNTITLPGSLTRGVSYRTNDSALKGRSDAIRDVAKVSNRLDKGIRTDDTKKSERERSRATPYASGSTDSCYAPSTDPERSTFPLLPATLARHETPTSAQHFHCLCWIQPARPTLQPGRSALRLYRH